MADNSVSALAREMAMGAGTGAAMGGATSFMGGLPAMAAGAANGSMAGAAVPLARYLMPNHADAAGMLANGAFLPFPLNIPALFGGGMMMMGAQPYTQEQFEQMDAAGR